MVLELSKREGEESGNTEAYGAIADCYTELGDLEKAAKFYDQYIARLETDWLFTFFLNVGLDFHCSFFWGVTIFVPEWSTFMHASQVKPFCYVSQLW